MSATTYSSIWIAIFTLLAGVYWPDVRGLAFIALAFIALLVGVFFWRGGGDVDANFRLRIAVEGDEGGLERGRAFRIHGVSRLRPRVDDRPDAPLLLDAHRHGMGLPPSRHFTAA